MYDDIAYYVRSCHACQLNSRRKPIIPYKYSRVPTVLRHFSIDTVHMSTGYGGKEYLLHAHDSLSQWPEAEALGVCNNITVSRFVYKEIICRFGCMPLFTVDRGKEFIGVAELLQSQYGVNVLFSSAYHPEGNGGMERAHQTLVYGVYKCAGDDKLKWPLYVAPVLFSIRVTASRMTGHPPYFMLYGIQPMFSFDFDDSTWATLDWHEVRDTPTLIALRAKQIARRDEVAEKAHQQAVLNRKRAIDDHNARYKAHETFHDFEPGMWVLRHETWLDNQKGNKDKWRWTGPFIVHEKHDNNVYTLRELDGTVMRGNITAHRLKLFFYREPGQVLKTVSQTHYDAIKADNTLSFNELQPFYSCFVTHLTGNELSDENTHLIPNVMHVPGEVHYPINADLTLPREFEGHPCFRELFSDNGRFTLDEYLKDIYPRDMEMLRLSTSATHAAYLAEPRMQRDVPIRSVDRAIEVSYHTNDTFIPPHIIRQSSHMRPDVPFTVQNIYAQR